MQGISVVICTYNGVARLANTLRSIVLQEAPGASWELIIIDNASTDGTAEFCRKFLLQEEFAINWKVVNEPQAGLNYARLCGLNSSQYDVVLFCDDDNQLDPSYLKIGNELMCAHPRIGALGGNGIPMFNGSKPKWFDKYAYSFAVGSQAGYSGRLTDMPSEVYGAGSFFRTAPLKELFAKGFETIMTDRLGKSLASGGDVEWCYLVQLTGYEIWYDDRLKFYHLMPASRMNWEYYLRLKQGISSGSARLLAYHAFFADPKMTEPEYLTRWRKEQRSINLYLLKSKLVNVFQPITSSPARQLALVKLQARKEAFHRDAELSLKHFRQLKKYFSK